MTDRADTKAREIALTVMHSGEGGFNRLVGNIAAALREARREALEEAAKGLEEWASHNDREFGDGAWWIVEMLYERAAAIRALKDKPT